MDLITPDIGLLFWTTLVFIILLVMLRKFAWTPILQSVRNRNSSIADALNAAEKASIQIKEMKTENEKFLTESKVERDNIVKEAIATRDKLIKEAKNSAIEESAKLFEAAKAEIENERIASANLIKEQIASFSIDIAKKILKKELSDSQKNDDLLTQSIDELKLN